MVYYVDCKIFWESGSFQEEIVSLPTRLQTVQWSLGPAFAELPGISPGHLPWGAPVDQGLTSLGACSTAGMPQKLWKTARGGD